MDFYLWYSMVELVCLEDKWSILYSILQLTV